MKVKTIIKLLQDYSTPEEEVMIQWWTKKDTESAMGGVIISTEAWSKAVDLWDDEPQGAREAGVMECVRTAKDIIKDQRRKDDAAKFKLILGGMAPDER
jgi:hypothetical protein